MKPLIMERGIILVLFWGLPFSLEEVAGRRKESAGKSKDINRTQFQML